MTLRPRQRRLLWLLAVLLATAAVVFAVLRAFNDNLVFFYTPSQILAQQVPKARAYRLGGQVVPGSVKRESGSLAIEFRVGDAHHSVPVRYSGLTPDLFREGKGVVAEGAMREGVFEATHLLAKHDENYMPPDLSRK